MKEISKTHWFLSDSLHSIETITEFTYIFTNLVLIQRAVVGYNFSFMPVFMIKNKNKQKTKESNSFNLLLDFFPSTIKKYNEIR